MMYLLDTCTVSDFVKGHPLEQGSCSTVVRNGHLVKAAMRARPPMFVS